MLAALLLTALAQSPVAETTPAWTVQVDPLTTALGFVHVLVERRVHPCLSVYAGPHARLFDGAFITDGHEPFVGWGAETGARFFPQGTAPEGVWIGLRGVVAALHTTDGTRVNGVGGYASALAGYQAILGKRWVLSGALGVNWMHYTLGDYGPSGVLPAAHTAIGVAF